MPVGASVFPEKDLVQKGLKRHEKSEDATLVSSE
jgi:hypothetical protein